MQTYSLCWVLCSGLDKLMMVEVLLLKIHSECSGSHMVIAHSKAGNFACPPPHENGLSGTKPAPNELSHHQMIYQQHQPPPRRQSNDVHDQGPAGLNACYKP